MTDKERLRLGTAIRAKRLAKRLTQQQVAREPGGKKNSGVSLGTLQMIEKGVGREVRASNIQKVVNFLETSIDDLLKADVTPTDPRLVGLRAEDLRIARQYHDSETTVRNHVRLLLDEGEEGRLNALLASVLALPSDLAHGLLDLFERTIQERHRDGNNPTRDRDHNNPTHGVHAATADDGPRTSSPKLISRK